ncbi:replication initiator [Streptomyces tropicalis]|uniref:replication initiator n=1 Tax=Streptomyces tropicalis TaxID=3034234 RepID=UPI0028BD1A30|nr:replication initiator [Streptomyces tropicalis]
MRHQRRERDRRRTDHSPTARADVEAVPATEHVRALLRTCRRLGGLPEFEPLRLRAWAHTLGYRGHILTKSRVYSTTYAALRAERAQHAGHLAAPDQVTEQAWRYVGSGHTPGAALVAAGIADDLVESRRLRLEARRAGSEASDCHART